MAAVAASQVTTVLTQGVGQVVEWLRISNVTTADTIDVSTIGLLGFKKVTTAVWFGRGQGTGVAAVPAGTVITLTSAGLANDTVELLILGEV